MNLSDDTHVELYRLKKQLEEYNLSFFQIAKESPKVEKTKNQMVHVLSFVVKNEQSRKAILNLKNFPTKLIFEETGIHPRHLRRHRSYIIAVLLILTGDYPIISQYFKNMREKEN